MLKCTYVVLLNNDEGNIPFLIDSLKKINGNFKKEFIIIDDGSKDHSLNIAKSAINDLPKTTIITQNNQGPALSINKALSITSGDYIHFVDGGEILHPDSTNIMIDACVKFGAGVACALTGEEKNYSNSKIIPNIKLVSEPLKEILVNKKTQMRNVGSSGSLAHLNLLEKIDRADNSIYSQTMSLSLRCAKYSNFTLINNVLSLTKKSSLEKESKFETYNNIRSIYNFASDHADIFKPLIPELMIALAHELVPAKSKIIYQLQSLKAKYLKTLKLETVLELYKVEYEKLF